MKTKLPLLIVLLLIKLSVNAQITTNSVSYIETTAIVDTLVVPDRIYLSILITEKDTKGRISVEELENKMNTKLTNLGIDIGKQLKLSDVTSNFKKYFLRSKDVLKNKTYTLVVYDAETLGKVITGLESIKISNVYLTKTEYSKIEELKINLKQDAVHKAKRQAESMLKPLNQNLGKALYISDLSPNITNRALGISLRENIYIPTALGIERKSTNIEFEKIKVESTIIVKFKLL